MIDSAWSAETVAKLAAVSSKPFHTNRLSSRCDLNHLFE